MAKYLNRSPGFYELHTRHFEQRGRCPIQKKKNADDEILSSPPPESELLVFIKITSIFDCVSLRIVSDNSIMGLPIPFFSEHIHWQDKQRVYKVKEQIY
jgi:hypothetical protein